jgi:hypothetical protein
MMRCHSFAGTIPTGFVLLGDDFPMLTLLRPAVVGVVCGADAAADDQAVRVHQDHREQPGRSRLAAASRSRAPLLASVPTATPALLQLVPAT